MKRNILLTAAIMMVVCLLASCNGKDEDVSAKQDQKTEETIVVVEEQKEEKAPEAKAEKKADKFVSMNGAATIEGDAIDDSYYQDYDVVIVNMMSTTCPACVKEMPDLQKLHDEDNGIGVVGIIADTIDRKTGEKNADNITAAVGIKEKVGSNYPFVVPTAELLGDTMGKLAPIFPMSFIVDKDGKVLKGPIAGAHSFDEWLSMANECKASAK